MPKQAGLQGEVDDIQENQDIIDIMNSDLEDIPIPEAESAERESEEDNNE